MTIGHPSCSSSQEEVFADLNGGIVQRWTLPANARSHDLGFYDLGDGAALINVNLLRAVGDRAVATISPISPRSSARRCSHNARAAVIA